MRRHTSLRKTTAVNSDVGISHPVERVAHTKLGRAVDAVRTTLRAATGRANRDLPVTAGQMTRAQEAQETREYALTFLENEPRFAADLCAAADRHERGDSV